MRPILIKIGALPVRSWGVMVVIGILSGLYLARRLAIKKGIDGEKVLNLGFYVVLAGLLGGRIIFVLLDLPYFLADPIQIIMINLGGLSIQGAILGGFVAGYFYCRYHKLNFGQVADVFAPALLLGQAIGRIGCLLNGDSYGKVTDFFLKVKFPHLDGLRHPVQLYESFLVFIAFVLVYRYRDRFKKEGTLFGLAIIAYSSIRFIVEFFRESEILTLGLSWAQVASLITVLVIGIIIYRSFGQPSNVDLS